MSNTTDIHAGTVVQAMPDANGESIRIWVDFGPDIGIRKALADIAGLYRVEDLMGLQVLASLAGASGNGDSGAQCELLTCPREDGAPVLITPHMYVPDGAKLK